MDIPIHTEHRVVVKYKGYAYSVSQADADEFGLHNGQVITEEYYNDTLGAILEEELARIVISRN